MKQITASLCFLLCLHFAGFANDKDTIKNAVPTHEVEEIANIFARLDSVEKSIVYKHGVVKLDEGNAVLNIPAGFKFVNAADSRFIIEDLWQNLPDPSVLGMIVSDSFHVNSPAIPWVFILTYDGMGYVKDDDADEINYDDLLKDMKEGQNQANIERKKLGYSTLNLVGWASKPYYDSKNKVLHWAKELKVEGDEGNTLNYDVRVLGRKGVLSLNAGAGIDQLEDVKKNIPAILQMASFEKGHTYSEFNPDVDEVAAWTIGGLVAGKVLAKAGVLAMILKFWKFIVLGVVAAGSFIWKLIRSRKKEELAVETVTTNDENSSAA